jgi:hypothetical protein
LLQLEAALIAKFEKTNMEDSLQLDMECDGHPRALEKYIEAWAIQLWEHGFLGFFKGKESYSKTAAFGDTSTLTLLSSVSFLGTSIAWVLKHSTQYSFSWDYSGSLGLLR